MAVETADDRLILLADFGVAATFTPAGGGASTALTVIFDNAYEALTLGVVQHLLSRSPESRHAPQI